MNVFKEARTKIVLLSIISLVIVAFSSICVGKGGQCIMPIYVMLLEGLGVPSLAFAVVMAIVVWFSIGIFSPNTSANLANILNLITTSVGIWWLFSSREIALTYTSITFYITSIALFSVVQGFCWLWGVKLKRSVDFNYTRSILTIFISLNLSWTLMTSYGIH